MSKNASKIIPLILGDKAKLKKISSVHLDMGTIILSNSPDKLTLYGVLYIFEDNNNNKVKSYDIDSNEDLKLSIKLMEAFVKGKEF